MIRSKRSQADSWPLNHKIDAEKSVYSTHARPARDGGLKRQKRNEEDDYGELLDENNDNINHYNSTSTVTKKSVTSHHKTLKSNREHIRSTNLHHKRNIHENHFHAKSRDNKSRHLRSRDKRRSEIGHHDSHKRTYQHSRTRRSLEEPLEGHMTRNEPLEGHVIEILWPNNLNVKSQ